MPCKSLHCFRLTPALNDEIQIIRADFIGLIFPRGEKFDAPKRQTHLSHAAVLQWRDSHQPLTVTRQQDLQPPPFTERLPPREKPFPSERHEPRAAAVDQVIPFAAQVLE